MNVIYENEAAAVGGKRKRKLSDEGIEFDPEAAYLGIGSSLRGAFKKNMPLVSVKTDNLVKESRPSKHGVVCLSTVHCLFSGDGRLCGERDQFLLLLSRVG
jgi:hypothetical protein